MNIMAYYAVSFVLLALIVYFTLSYRVTEASAKRLATFREELTSLYVKRANLMPYLMNAARKYSPIPQDIYSRFVCARDKFAKASREKDIREANLDLDGIFAAFFAYYAAYTDPRFVKHKEEYDKLAEKIAFSIKFYEEAYVAWKRVRNGPYSPAMKLLSAAKSLAVKTLQVFSKIIANIFRRSSGS